MKPIKSLVSVDWLFQNLENPNLIVIDGTMKKITSDEIESEAIQIKNARYLDIKNVFSDTTAKFPNTMLSSSEFERRAQQLGVNKDSCIVVYDAVGVYSSPRIWWMFTAMGFENSAVLNGGLPAWIAAGYPTEKKKQKQIEKGNFKAKYNADYFCNFSTVLQNIKTTKKIVLDARSLGRFNATISEPRKGLRGGHIPKSKNLEYSKILNKGRLKSVEELKIIFKSLNPEDKEMIFSCGSGITASILAFSAYIAGYEKGTVYDGSWTEWGSLIELPIEK